MSRFAIVAALLLAAAGVWALWPRGTAAPPVQAASPGSGLSPAPPPPVVPVVAHDDPVRRAELEAPLAEDGAAAAAAAAAPRADGLCALVVRVVFAADGSPAAGVHVGVESLSVLDPELTACGGSTSDDGICRFDDLRSGSWWIRLDRAGDRRVYVAPGCTLEVTIEIPSGTRISGLVVDDRDRPVAGARVWLSQEWSWRRGTVVARTDGEGRFALRDVAPDRWLGARATGFAPSALTRLAGHAGEALELRIAVGGRGASVRGIVRDRAGAPVAGAVVLVGREDDEHRARDRDGGTTPDWPPFLLRTADDGAFAAEDVGSGRIPVQVRARGFAPWTGAVELAPGETRHVDVTLERGGSVLGTVRDELGKPLENVAVAACAADPTAPSAPTFDDVMSTGRWSEFHRVRGYTRADGGYRLDNAPVGLVWVVAGKADRAGAAATLRVPAGGEVEWSPQLAASLQLHGVVQDAAGRPLADWLVRIHREDGEESGATGPRYHFTRTGKDGGFRFDRRPSVAHEVAVHESAEAGTRKRLERKGVLPGAPVVLVVEAAAAADAAFTGRVLDAAGRALAGAKVSAWCGELDLSRHAHSGDDGAFELGDLPPGRYWVRVSDDAHAWTNLGFVELAPHQRRSLGEVRLAAGNRLRGRILSARSELREALRLVLLGRNGEAGTVDVREDGYRSAPLAAGDYTLQISGEGIAAQQVAVRIEAGRDSVLDLEVRAGVRHGLRIAVPGADAALRWVHASVYSDPGGMVAAQTAHRSGDAFTCTFWLAPGRYKAMVFVEGGRRRGEAMIDVGVAGAETTIVVDR
jgi:hypothetical protein